MLGTKGRRSDVRLYPCPDTHVLELSVISAQNLYPQFKRMKTYAVATVHEYPEKEWITRIDPSGGTDPTWDAKFVLCIDGSFLRSDTSAINVTIFAVRKWLHFCKNDAILGQTRILVKTFLNPINACQAVALQIRRPKTLRPQGILNISICLLGNSEMLTQTKHDHCALHSVATNAIISGPSSMQYERMHNIDEDIEYATSQQRHLIDKLGQLDKSRDLKPNERNRWFHIFSKPLCYVTGFKFLKVLEKINVKMMTLKLEPIKERYERIEESRLQAELLRCY